MSRDLLLVAISLFTWGVGEGMFIFLQPIYLEQLGADPLVIGTIMSGFFLAMSLAHIPAGYIADRLGRRPVMWVSWLLGLIATWFMAMAPSLSWFIVGLLIYGLTFFVMSPLNSYVTAARGHWPVSRAIMVISAAFNLGMVIGAFVGGRIADLYSLKRVFFTAGIIFIVSTLIILFIRSQPIEHHPAGEKRLGFLANPRLRYYLIAVFLAVFATVLPQPLSQNYLHTYWNLDMTTIGALTALVGLGVAVISLVLGRLDARLAFLLAQATVAGFAFLLWQGNGPAWFAVGYFLLGGYKTTRALATAQTRSLVSSSAMGIAYGITETVGSIAAIIAPSLAGAIYGLNPSWVYPASLVSILIAIVVGAIFSPRSAEAEAVPSIRPVVLPSEDP
jgi:MFS family permease